MLLTYIKNKSDQKMGATPHDTDEGWEKVLPKLSRADLLVN